uniref:Uncharacterized protein n=2 Tax=Avena sativa TaxID=4498 RepID=A0ACD5WMM6_AVESA
MTIPRAVAGGVMHALVAGVFGAAGTVLGAAYGLLSAAFVDEGFARGTLLGAVAGALVSLDLAHSLLAIWCCRSPDYTCTGRIKRTVTAIYGLASLADPRSGRGQRVTVFDDDENDEVDWSTFLSPPVAVVVVAKETAAADCTTCPICLEGFEAGAGGGGQWSAGRLPGCSHVYHVECITRWLRCKSHCPMCRHAVC